MLNTLTIKQLEDAQNKIAKKWQAHVISGIQKSKVHVIDGLVWIHMAGVFDKTDAQELAQDLSQEMNICIFLNRLECWFKSGDAIYLVLDIDYNSIYKNVAVPAFEGTAHISTYGVEFKPDDTLHT